MEQGLALDKTSDTRFTGDRDHMSKEQKSNREKKKPKQDKTAKLASAGTAYAQAKAGAKR
jgi:hypothetical protein